MSSKKMTSELKIDSLFLEHMSNLEYVINKLNRYWSQARYGDFTDISNDIAYLAKRGAEEADIIIKDIIEHAPDVMKLLGKESATFMQDTLNSCKETCKYISESGGVISKTIGDTLKGLFDGLKNLIKLVTDKFNELTTSYKHEPKNNNPE